MFRKLKAVFVQVAMANGKARVRRQLLAMSDKQLEDFGFARHLLLQGVSAWPWRERDATDLAQADKPAIACCVTPRVTQVAPAMDNRRTIQTAIQELSSYSDRELAELGVTRHGIEEAVRYGRPAVEGEHKRQKNAA